VAGELHHVFGGIRTWLFEEGNDDVVDDVAPRVEEVG
jgi:hypothetical protein